MARKKRTTAVGLDAIFSQVDQYGDGGREGQSTLLLVEAIRPDPGQPRRLLPPDLYERLFAGESPDNILSEWLARAAESAERSIVDPLLQKVNSLHQLADTIEQHGLINAITVQENGIVPGADYLIITGERRWWAHVLLNLEGRPVKGRTADEIEAKVAPAEAVRALQLIENMARDDLTAWERATGIQALREELGGTEVTWTSVEKMLGISRQHRSRIMRVLRLGNEAQALVRDYGLAEKTIRPVTDKLLKQPNLQVAALRQLISWQQASEESGHARLDGYVDRLLAREAGQPARASGFNVGRWTSTFGRRVKKTLSWVSELDDGHVDEMAAVLAEDDNTRQALAQLREHIDWLLTITEKQRQVEE